MVAADHVLFDDTHHCLQMDDDNEHVTIVMEDEDEAEVKEEDEQELIILPFMGTCSKQIRGFSNKNGCMVIPVSKAKDSKVMCELCCDILKSNATLERHEISLLKLR